MTSTPLRIGVIGVGFGATVHVPAFQSEGWDVRTVWSRRADRSRAAAAELGVPDADEDWRSLIARGDIDAVAITTPPAAHHEQVMAALAAGKHVLCEKPFALNAGEAAEMRDAAAARGLTAMVAHEFRFAPQRAQIRLLLEEGAIGTPQLVSAELLLGRAAPETPPAATWGAWTAEGGGVLGALGSHYIDGFRHWFGDVATASGTLTTLRPARRDPETNAPVRADADDAFTFTLTFASGVILTMTASIAVSPGPGGRIAIAGSDGVLMALQRGGNPEPDGVVLAGKASDRALAPLEMPERFRPFDDDRDQRLMAFRLLVREFERGIRTATSPAPNFDDAHACQAVLDAVRLSAREGRRVPLG